MYSKNEIKRLKEGKELDHSPREGRPFVIIRENIKVFGLSATNWQWGIASSPEDDDYQEISRTDADDIIRNNAMEVAYDKPYGQIYELPGNPFHQMFRNRSNV